MKRRSRAIAALLLLAVTRSGPLPAQQAPERELERVQSEIRELEQERNRQQGRRKQGVEALKEVELALAATRAEQRSLAEAVARQRAEQRRIATERQSASAQLDSEQEALADQVRMSYMTGPQELVKLLLSQESPTDFGRMLVYYDYLNRHRSERIASVDTELARLGALARENEAATVELERLEGEQAEKAASLASDEADRRQLIAELDAAIETTGARIEQMRAEETELNELIARLARELESFPRDSEAPFADQKGQLRWPVDGRLAARFGEPRDAAGIVRWQGVLLEAPAGTPVRAIYHGRVVLAEWTRQMGLLIILDHGDGYMSLYGHNAALLREQGDWVKPGDIIAEVGDTGGQLGMGLYFDIRKDGEPVNPAGWIR